MADPLLLFDVDKDLATDHTGAILNRIEGELIDARNGCKAALDGGLPWEEAGKIEKVTKAISVALILLPKLQDQLKS
jgi:hypothetical protein